LTEDDAIKATAPTDKGMISFLASFQILRLLFLDAASPFLPFLDTLSLFGAFSVMMDSSAAE
jgi:hypothetical protein